jgi:aminoglycoside/choline kinase family phosphotransferase
MAERDAPESVSDRLLAVLEEHGVRPLDIVPLAGDVSLRRYFRLRLSDQRTVILATYPAEMTDSCERFDRTSSLLAEVGVRVPRIRLSLCRNGLMLLEDLGERTLYDLGNRGWDQLRPYLEEAARLIDGIRSIPPSAVPPSSPPLDRDLLAEELARSWELLTGPSGIAPGQLSPALADAFDTMIERLAAAPRVPCHRDFMARNLIPIGEPPNLAVIDHQDLRLGPATYDLASLLNDSIYPPPEIETALVDASLRDGDRHVDYHRAAVQRTLKAVGTFLSFALRGDDRHRILVRPTLERARYHVRNLPEMRQLSDELDRFFAALLEPGSTG